MNIRNRYAKVCLFLWVLGCLTAHSLKAQIRHTCPIKNGAGGRAVFTVREHKTLYKLAGFRSAASGKLLASIAGSFEEREKKDTQNTFSVDS